MNSLRVQIFGTKKCNETKKAERFFKERGIKYQFLHWAISLKCGRNGINERTGNFGRKDGIV